MEWPNSSLNQRAEHFQMKPLEHTTLIAGSCMDVIRPLVRCSFSNLNFSNQLQAALTLSRCQFKLHMCRVFVNEKGNLTDRTEA